MATPSTPCVYGPVGACFGFYACDWEKKLKDDGARIFALVNIASWIPIIGSIIAGILHIKMGVDMYREAHDQNGKVKWSCEDQVTAGKIMIARGIAEILCMGTLLMIVDLVVTIARACIQVPNN